MKYLFISILFLNFGCSANQLNVENKFLLSSGTWVGDLEKITTKNLPNGDREDNYELIVLACASELEFWIKQDDTGFVKIYSNYKIETKSDSSLLYLIEDGGSWVEIQSWAIVPINEYVASVQWNRMVSNPEYDSGHELRTFGQLGYGVLEKISNDCDIWE